MPKWNTVGILVAGTFMVFAQSALAAGDVENGKKVYKKCAACHYIADPKGYIPKNRMAFAGLKKEQDRADVIAYIKENAQ